MSPAVYVGRRDRRVALVTRDGGPLRGAKPGEIEWGFEGQGPLTLAKALLVAACGPSAREHAYAFMRAVVARLPEPGWTLTADEIAAWVATATPAVPSTSRPLERPVDVDAALARVVSELVILTEELQRPAAVRAITDEALSDRASVALVAVGSVRRTLAAAQKGAA